MKSIKEMSPREYEKMVDFMRADLESNMAYSKIIDKAKELLESQGRDFNKEFESWEIKKEKKDGKNNCTSWGCNSRR